jgi:lysozyme
MTVRELIERHEGCRLAKYADSRGFWTIGWGHNLDATPLPPDYYEPDGTISQATADEILDGDLENATEAIKDIFGATFGRLDEVRQAVLIDMTFEMGPAKMREFGRTLGRIRLGNYSGAAQAMLASLWAHQVPKRAQEDAQMMMTGVWPA